MDRSRLSIGELARASGLSVSALRFYDHQGLLAPAEVAEHSGYRWYAPEQVDDALLLAGLRRVGLPLAEMAALLARRERAATILAEHVRRLEEGLAAARAEVGLIQERWGAPGAEAAVHAGPGSAGAGRPRSDHGSSGLPTDDDGATILLNAADLAAGLRTVRHAVGDDPDLPAIHGVFLVSLSGALRLSATDRTRAAFAEVPAECSGKIRALLPTEHADDLAASLAASAPEATLVLSLQGRQLSVRQGSELLLDIEVPQAHFPDLSHAIPQARNSADLHAADLSQALAEYPGTRAWWLGVDGGLVPADPPAVRADGEPKESGGAPSPASGAVLLDGSYLVDALEALRNGSPADGPTQLRLDLDGPVRPLALRRAEDPGSFVVLLPIRPAPEAPG